MAETAYSTVYAQEAIAALEQRQSLLRMTCTTEGMASGQIFTFLVAGSGNRTASTRGINGLYPTNGNDNTQVACTLVDWTDLAETQNFNIFASQADQRKIMNQNVVAVVNRKTDQLIIDELETTTINTGATAQQATFLNFQKALVKLQNAKVPLDGSITALVTPAYHAYMQGWTEFHNAQVVNAYPVRDNEPAWKDQPQMYRWMGTNIIVHPDLPGNATSAEKCFVYHKSGVGHASNVGGYDIQFGYEGKQNSSWARCTSYQGAKLLINAAVVQINHDGSAFA